MDVDVKIYTDLSLTYLDIAKRYMDDAVDNLNKSKKATNQKQAEYISKERKNSLFAIIFSALALEASINHFILEKFEKANWDNLMMTKLEVKWLFLPKIIDPSFNLANDICENLRKTIKWRNKLIHYKYFVPEEPVRHPSGSQVSHLYNITNANNAKIAHTTAVALIDELKKVKK